MEEWTMSRRPPIRYLMTPTLRFSASLLTPEFTHLSVEGGICIFVTCEGVGHESGIRWGYLRSPIPELPNVACNPVDPGGCHRDYTSNDPEECRRCDCGLPGDICGGTFWSVISSFYNLAPFVMTNVWETLGVNETKTFFISSIHNAVSIALFLPHPFSPSPLLSSPLSLSLRITNTCYQWGKHWERKKSRIWPSSPQATHQPGSGVEECAWSGDLCAEG